MKLKVACLLSIVLWSEASFAVVGSVPVGYKTITNGILNYHTEYNSCGSNGIITGLNNDNLSNIQCGYEPDFGLSDFKEVQDETNVKVHTNKDWAKNWHKRECPKGYAAVGLGTWNDGGSLLCAKLTRAGQDVASSKNCSVQWFDKKSNNQQSLSDPADFLPDAYKLWVHSSQYIAGVASYSNNYRIAAALVCEIE